MRRDPHDLLANGPLMDEFNPYAPPESHERLEPYTPKHGGLWRDGSLLVMVQNTSLPDRCLKCNLPAGGWTLRRKLWWHPRALYFLILLHILIYIIVALLVRKSAVVYAPLCERHRKLRRRAIIVGWTLSILAIGIVVAAASAASGDTAALWILAGAILFLGAIIYGVAGSQVAVPKKIDDRFVWIKNVSPEFLAELPGWAWSP
jgi:hypothetical protein